MGLRAFDKKKIIFNRAARTSERFLRATAMKLKIKAAIVAGYSMRRDTLRSRPPFADDSILIVRPDLALEQPRGRVPFLMEISTLLR